MSQPTSLRLPDDVKHRLDQRAARGQEKASALAVRLIDEGLRMAEHPGIAFHASLAHGRVAALAGGPDVAEVIDVLQGLHATGDERLSEAAAWFGIHASRIRVALDYYSAFSSEIDRQIDVRQIEAAEQRGRYEAQQALLK